MQRTVVLTNGQTSGLGNRTLSPEIAALSMSGSSAVVAINALPLKRTRLDGIKKATPNADAVPEPAAAPARRLEG